jgi:hypothetical protein
MGENANPRSSAMDLTPAQHQERERFFTALLEAIFPLKQGPDPEVTLELLIQAVDILRDHLEHELEEIRLEQAE